MRRHTTVFKMISSLLLVVSCAPAIAGTLYQWTGKDGTPTYSPDPPPAGVNYELVGADLKPLPKNIDMSKPVVARNSTVRPSDQISNSATPAQTQQTQTTQKAETPALPQPAKKPVVPWKPVRYANDPNPPAKKAIKAVKPKVDPVAVARNSPECRQARQQMVLLESQFAQALTDQQMDRAVLQLSDHSRVLKTACKFN